MSRMHTFAIPMLLRLPGASEACTMEMPSDMEGSGLLTKTQISWLPMARESGAASGARERVKSFCSPVQVQSNNSKRRLLWPVAVTPLIGAASEPGLDWSVRNGAVCDSLAHSIAIARPRTAPPELRVLLCAPACGTFMTSGRTAVLMADDRPPMSSSSAPTGRALTYPSLAFAINAEYTCRHGYDLLYFQMGSRCTHPTQGERSASYCKLPAIAAALADGYERVAFIDSDSFFLHRGVSLPELVQRYRPPPHRAPPDPAVWFASDMPQLGDRPNGGFHVWSRGRDSQRVLRTWWHLRGGKYNRVHDFEQHSLQWALGHLAGASGLLGTLQLKAMDDEFQHAVAHIDHTKSGRRLWRMSVELLRAAFDAARDSNASAGSPIRLPPLAQRRLKLQRLLRSAQTVSAVRGPTLALKQQLLQAAVLLLRPAARKLARLSVQGSGSGGGGGAGPLTQEGGATVVGGASCGTSGGRLRVIPFNASAWARVLLPADDLLPLDGAPLLLLPCATSAASVLQEWTPRRDGRWALAASPALCLQHGPRKVHPPAPRRARPYGLLCPMTACACRRRRKRRTRCWHSWALARRLLGSNGTRKVFGCSSRHPQQGEADAYVSVQSVESSLPMLAAARRSMAEAASASSLCGKTAAASRRMCLACVSVCGARNRARARRLYLTIVAQRARPKLISNLAAAPRARARTFSSCIARRRAMKELLAFLSLQRG